MSTFPCPPALLAECSAVPPRRVLLFSGHMIDTHDRPSPRLPASSVPHAAVALTRTLQDLGAGPADVALSQAANGGDILFLQACIELGVRCQVLLPFPESEFIRRSVVREKSTRGSAARLIDDPSWLTCYHAIKARLSLSIFDAPTELEALAEGDDPYERCNEWLLSCAQEIASLCTPQSQQSSLHFVTIWDGQRGWGRGGTDHLCDRAQSVGAVVHWIDSRQWLKQHHRVDALRLAVLVLVLFSLRGCK